jgi:acetyltransferase
MTTRNLDFAFRPRSLAIVGASERAGSLGTVVVRNVRSGGFDGTVYLVNPKHLTVQGLHCYRSVDELPEGPDLAVIATPAATVPGVVSSLAAKGCRAAVVITAGLGIQGGLRQKLLQAARPSQMRIIGPNTIGLLSPRVSLNASFAHIAPLLGSLGLISQSGAIVSSVIDWAAAEQIGFSQILSLGDMADVDVGDCLNWLAADRHTSAILMYLETIPAARKFMSAARAAARNKPVIVVKPGRHQASAKAALTHTGSLAGRDDVIDAALRRAGIIRVDDLEDLFYAAEITARCKPLQQARVAIVTNGGGAGVLAVDKLLDERCSLAELSAQTTATLEKALPATWSRANPVDIVGDAPPGRYRAALEAVAADPGVDTILAMNCPTALASPLEAAQAVSGMTSRGLLGGKPLIACWLGKAAAEPAREIFRRAGVATADTPAGAAQAVSLLTRWATLRSRLDRVPASHGEVVVDRPAAASVIEAVGTEGRSMLTEPEAKRVLAAYGIAVPRTLVASSSDHVPACAEELLSTFPAVVVKLLSRSLTHKSDVGGVVLGLTSPADAHAASIRISDRVLASGAPTGAIEGYAIQAMITRPHAVELILGLHRDAGFGTTIVFGAGGTSVEVVKDTAVGLVPLDALLAGDLIDNTRVAALLRGYRDRLPAQRDALVQALLALSQLAIDFPCILSADINPLLADQDGVIALDARIEIEPSRASEQGPGPELAVRPYPAGWERTVNAGGTRYGVRPMKPADAALYPRFLERVTPEDMRLRFLVATRTLSRETIVRLSQLDYDRDIAFIALDVESGELAGVVRYSSDPDHVTAEFSAHVRSDLQGRGLGTAMMRILIEYARADGLVELAGLVLRENAEMLKLASSLGFCSQSSTSEPGCVRIALPLHPRKP